MKTTHNAIVLEVLADGDWHDHLELYALNVIAHSRVAELRKLGYTIERAVRVDGGGKRHYRYRLAGVPAGGCPFEVQLEPQAQAALSRLRIAGDPPAPEVLTESPVSQRQAGPVDVSAEASLVSGAPGRSTRSSSRHVERDNDGARADSPCGGASGGVSGAPIPIRTPDALLEELRAIDDELSAIASTGVLVDDELLLVDELERRRRELERRLTA